MICVPPPHSLGLHTRRYILTNIFNNDERKFRDFTYERFLHSKPSARAADVAAEALVWREFDPRFRLRYVTGTKDKKHKDIVAKLG